MLPLSIVILTKNEEQNIARCLQPLIDLTDDILIVDNGSTDNTIDIAKSMNATIFQTTWKGYSETKNEGNAKAKYDWILSLDADEVMNEDLKKNIIQLFTTKINENEAYLIKRKLVYKNHILHFGALSNEYRLRLFNKKNASWNSNEVHEDVCFIENITKVKLKGFVWHYSYKSTHEHISKLDKYANLFAHQKRKQGKKASFIKLFCSPIWGFIKNYIFRLGFLDGKFGFQFAKNEMWYTFRKYQLLNTK